MISEEDKVLIQSYLDGDLSERDKVLFEEKKIGSPEFIDQIRFTNSLNNHLKAHRKFERKQEMLEDFRSLRKTSQGQKKMHPARIRYAVAAILLIALTYSAIILIRPKTNEDLFVEYFSPYQGAVVMRGDNSTFSLGINEYSSGNYSEALEYLLENVNSDSSSVQIKLLISNCYLELGEIEKSIVWLKKPVGDDESFILHATDWYLSLALLRNQEIQESKALLYGLVESESIYSARASKLLEERVYD